MHFVGFPVEELFDQQVADLGNIGELGAVGNAAEVGHDVFAAAVQDFAAFAPHGHIVHRHRIIVEGFEGVAQHVGVVRAGQAAVAGNEHHKDVLDLVATGHQRVHVFTARLHGDVRQHFPCFGGVGAGGFHRGNRPLHFAGTHRLQSAGDLRDVLDASNAEFDFSRGRHRPLSLAPAGHERVQGRLELRFGFGGDFAFADDGAANLGMRSIHEAQQVLFPLAHPV